MRYLLVAPDNANTATALSSSGSLAMFAAILRASSPERLEQSMGGGVFSKDEQGTVFSLTLVKGGTEDAT